MHSLKKIVGGGTSIPDWRVLIFHFLDKRFRGIAITWDSVGVWVEYHFSK